MNIGEILKNERVRQHLTVEDISKALKLHHSIIEDLENNRFESIAPVYAVGFIRKYCEFLKFDHIKIKEILDFYNNEIAKNIKTNIAPEGEVLETSDYKKSYLKVVLVFVFIFIVIFAGWYFYKKYRKDLKAVPEKKAKVREKAQNIIFSEKNSIKENTVRVVVLKKVFLTVYEGEDLVFSGVLKKGAKEHWKSEKTIVLRVALPDSIKLVVNGKDLGIIKQNMAYPNEIVVKKSGIRIRRFR